MTTYFVPRKLGQTDGQNPSAQWEDSPYQLDPKNAACVAMHDFLNNNPEGKFLTPSYYLHSETLKIAVYSFRLKSDRWLWSMIRSS